MEYKHQVQRWNGKAFHKVMSDSTEFYSMGAYIDGGDDIDDIETDTLGELYRLWQEQKDGDAAVGERGWKYHFYHHKIVEELHPVTEKLQFVDYVTEGKVYRRGTKIFFKPV